MSDARFVRFLDHLGAQSGGLLDYVGGLWYLAWETLKRGLAGIVRRPRIKADETFYQMVRLGVRAIPIVALVNLFVGMTLAFTLAPVLENYGQLDQLATVIAKAVFPQLGPLIAAIVLTGFAGAAIAAELVARQAYGVRFGPVGGAGDEGLDLVRVPPLLAVAAKDLLRPFVGDAGQDLLDGLGVGRIGHVLEVPPEVGAPGRALVGEVVRVVEVEVVDDVRVGDGLDLHQFVHTRPSGSRRD